jgi:geranylgeranyl diphosphate synthase type II
LFGNLSEDTFHAALALELFHNFTLIHDDIMDEAPLRRGKPAIHAEYGLPTGILAGDVMNIYAYEELSKINPSFLPAVLKIFNTTAIKVCEGQQLDMDYEGTDEVTVDEYLKMISLKTSVLLAASLRIGAVLGGAGKEDAENIYQFGKNLGIAFQLQDDYLDAFGKKEQTGKLPGGDIRSNKKTYLFIVCKSIMTNEQSDLLAKISLLPQEEKVKETISFYRTLGIDQRCKDIIAEYSSRSFDCLHKINQPEAKLKPLKELATALLERER